MQKLQTFIEYFTYLVIVEVLKLIDSAGIEMAQGYPIACERVEGINDNMVQSHYHDFYELYYLEAGQRYHIMKDETYLMDSGQFMLFPPYIMHRSYGMQDIPFKRIVLYFRADEVVSETLREALEGCGGLYTVEGKAKSFIHSILDTLTRESRSNSFSYEYYHSLLNILLVTILRDATPQATPVKQTLVEKVIEHIHTNYDKKITLDSLAQTFYVSPYYLCHEFKAHTKRTIVQYINVTRIMNAQRKIMESNKSFTDICNEVGFSNLTHFNRVFKSVTSMSPSSYRKMYKNMPVSK